MRKSQSLKKKYRFRKKRRFYKKKPFWFGILIFIIFAEIFYLFVFSSIFQVKKVEILGAEKIPLQNIQSLAQNYLTKNFLFFPLKSIFLVNFQRIRATLLEKYPEIANCTIQRKFPNKLVIKIEERKPAAILCQSENEVFSRCFFVDGKGVIFEKIQEENKDDYLMIKKNLIEKELKLGDKVFQEENLKKFLEVKTALKEKPEILLEEISQINEEKFIAKTKEGWEIYFNLKDDLKTQLRNLSLVLEKEISPERKGDLEYIDLRFGDKIYYKFK